MLGEGPLLLDEPTAHLDVPTPDALLRRLHGDAGIREFAVAKAVASSRLSMVPGLTGSMFGSIRPSAGQVGTVLRVLWGRGSRP